MKCQSPSETTASGGREGHLDRALWEETCEAQELVWQMTQRHFEPLASVSVHPHEPRSAQATPYEERDPDSNVSRPTHYPPGILSTLLKSYGHQRDERGRQSQHNVESPAAIRQPPLSIHP